MSNRTFRAINIEFGDRKINEDKRSVYFEATCKPRELIKITAGGIKFADDLTLNEAKLIIEQLIVDAKKVLLPAEVDREQ